MIDPVFFPDADTVDAAPLWLLAKWYEDLPFPRTDEEKDSVERIAVRCEGCGMVDSEGKLTWKA